MTFRHVNEMPPTLEEFTQEVEEFLGRHGRRIDAAQAAKEATATDRITVLDDAPREVELEHLKVATKWRGLRWDAGLGWINGPTAYGGRGLSDDHDTAYRELEAQYEVPSDAAVLVGLNIVAAAILAYGSPELCAWALPGLFSGELVACQLFSEPEAGSDLASIRARAVKVPGGYLVRGQKVWSSGAHISDLGLLLARTDAESDRHAGLTMFLLNMHQPGIDARPIRQMTGGGSFAEVFLEDAFLSDDEVVGPVGAGWEVARATLAVERVNIGKGRSTPGSDSLEMLLAIAREGERGATNSGSRVLLTDAYIATTVSRLLSEQLAGDEGPGALLCKLQFVRAHQAVSNAAMGVLGPAMVADTGKPLKFAWAEYACSVMALSIAGGTDEIVRNIVSERLLGLPRDPVLPRRSPRLPRAEDASAHG